MEEGKEGWTGGWTDRWMDSNHKFGWVLRFIDPRRHPVTLPGDNCRLWELKVLPTNKQIKQSERENKLSNNRISSF